jgi:hypothetical protein
MGTSVEDGWRQSSRATEALRSRVWECLGDSLQERLFERRIALVTGRLDDAAAASTVVKQDRDNPHWSESA